MKVNEKLKKLKHVKNISYIFVGKIVSMFLYQVYDIIIARKLNVQDYGEWAYFFSILNIFFFVGWFGVNSAARVYVSKANTSIEREKYVKAAFVVRFVISCVVTSLFVIFAKRMALQFGYPEKYPNLLWLFYFSGFIIFINSYTDLFKNLFQAIENFELLAIVSVLEYTGYLVFAIVFLNVLPSVKSVAIAYLTAGVVVIVFSILKHNKRESKLYQSVDWSCVKEIFYYALPMLVLSIGAIVLAEIDIIMLGMLGTRQDVSLYSIGKRLCDKAIHVNEAIVVGTVGTLAVINKDNLREKYIQFKKFSLLNALATCCTAILLVLLAIFFIPMLYGEEYARASQVTIMIIPYYILFGISYLCVRVLDFHGRVWIRSIWFLVVIGIDIVLNFFLIPVLGAYGAAIATWISLVPYTIYTMQAIRKWFKIQFKNSEISNQ